MLSRFFTLGHALRATLLFGFFCLTLIMVQSCQKPKTGIESYAVGSLKKLTVLDAPPAQPGIKFRTADEDEMRLSDYRGKVILVNAWATWCPPCVAEMPSLDRLQATRGGNDFEVVTISLDRRADEIDPFFDKIGVKQLTPWHDGSYAINGALRLPGLPTTVLYDRTGREVARFSGDAEWDSAEALALVDYLIGAEGN